MTVVRVPTRQMFDGVTTDLVIDMDRYTVDYMYVDGGTSSPITSSSIIDMYHSICRTSLMLARHWVVPRVKGFVPTLWKRDAIARRIWRVIEHERNTHIGSLDTEALSIMRKMYGFFGTVPHWEAAAWPHLSGIPLAQAAVHLRAARYALRYIANLVYLEGDDAEAMCYRGGSGISDDDWEMIYFPSGERDVNVSVSLDVIPGRMPWAIVDVVRVYGCLPRPVTTRYEWAFLDAVRDRYGYIFNQSRPHIDRILVGSSAEDFKRAFLMIRDGHMSFARPGRYISLYSAYYFAVEGGIDKWGNVVEMAEGALERQRRYVERVAARDLWRAADRRRQDAGEVFGFL